MQKGLVKVIVLLNGGLMATLKFAVFYPIAESLDQYLTYLCHNIQLEWDWYEANNSKINQPCDLDGVITETGILIIPESLYWRGIATTYNECRDQVFRLFQKYKFHAPARGLAIAIINVHM